jgi:hypothetical protein
MESDSSVDAGTTGDEFRHDSDIADDGCGCSLMGRWKISLSEWRGGALDEEKFQVKRRFGRRGGLDEEGLWMKGSFGRRRKLWMKKRLFGWRRDALDEEGKLWVKKRNFGWRKGTLGEWQTASVRLTAETKSLLPFHDTRRPFRFRRQPLYSNIAEADTLV